MTTYDLETYTYDGLGNVLRAHGGLNYFESITSSDEGSEYHTTLTKNGTSIVIREVMQDSHSNNMKIDDYAFRNNTSIPIYPPQRVKKVVVTDNAIVLIPTTYFAMDYPVPIVICKTANGSVAVVFNIYWFKSSSDATTITALSIDANGFKGVRETPFLPNNTSDSYLYATPIPTHDSVTKNVYLNLHRPFYAMAEPFMLTVGDASHASFGYNTILVKTQ